MAHHCHCHCHSNCCKYKDVQEVCCLLQRYHSPLRAKHSRLILSLHLVPRSFLSWWHSIDSQLYLSWWIRCLRLLTTECELTLSQASFFGNFFSVLRLWRSVYRLRMETFCFLSKPSDLSFSQSTSSYPNLLSLSADLI